jgi:hypothetical protein
MIAANGLQAGQHLPINAQLPSPVFQQLSVSRDDRSRRAQIKGDHLHEYLRYFQNRDGILDRYME